MHFVLAITKKMHVNIILDKTHGRNNGWVKIYKNIVKHEQQNTISVVVEL